MKRQVIIAALALALPACGTPSIQPPGAGHLRTEKVAPGNTATIPAPVQQALALPRPGPAPKVETYSVVVHNVKVQELLFALARDAKLNVDIHSGIEGTVTLNAIDQTLQQLLARIAKQVDLRWELDGPTLIVMPDTPFLRTYKVDYVNMSRDTSGNVAINTQIASISPTAAGAGGTGAAAGGTTGNISSTKVDSLAKNNLWDTLENNIKDILRETDKEVVIRRRVAGIEEEAKDTSPSPAPVPATAQISQATREYEILQAASVMTNRETGIVLVRASSRQHEKVADFLDKVMSAARRQVLIEATIVEVHLNKQYQQGIDWQYFHNGSTQGLIGQGNTTRTLRVNPTTGAYEAAVNDSTLPSAVSNTLFTLALGRGNFLAAVKLLENFGTLKVLSSPKLSVLNNQTALLKVVDNIIYFQVKTDTSQGQTSTLQNITTTPQSVSVGVVMSVTPQISDSHSVLLNVRPTISRVTGFKLDPHPALQIENRVPEIQTREMESLMKINDGDIAVLGGLMHDEINNTDDAVPGASKIPLIGNLFTYRNNITSRKELVIFMRPTVVKDASIQGEYRKFSGQLPHDDFFESNVLQPVPTIDFGSAPQ